MSILQAVFSDQRADVCSGVVELGEIQLYHRMCFEDFFETCPDSGRTIILCTSEFTLLSKPGRREIPDGQVASILNYVEWLRGLGYNATAVSFTNTAESWPTHEPERGVGIELSYSSSDNISFIYIGLCLIRFIAPEFLNHRIPKNAAVGKILSDALCNYPTYPFSHLPLSDGYGGPYDKNTGICMQKFIEHKLALPLRRTDTMSMLESRYRGPFKEYIRSGIDSAEFTGWLYKNATISA